MKNLRVALALALCATSVSAQTLLHHYSFDLDVSDSAGSANGTLGGGASVSGGRLSLDGSTGFVGFGSHIVPTSGSYTVAFFAEELVPQNNYAEMIAQGSSGGPGFYIGHSPAYGTRVTDSWGNTGVAFPNDQLFHHYALTVDSVGNTSKYYLDGELKATLGFAISTTTGGDDTRFGRQFNNHGEYFGGLMDEVRIYDGALNDLQVAALAGVPEPSTIGIALLAGGCWIGRRAWRSHSKR